MEEVFRWGDFYMKTKMLRLDEENINKEIIASAAKVIKDGGLVSFPTETVYGLGANGLDEQAIAKIFKAKGRPQDNPLILHISSVEELDELVSEISDEAKVCIDKFWPGPLTMIFKRSGIIPDGITAGLDTVAIRMPSNKIALELIRQAQRPIAAPSANISGKPSPTAADHVFTDLDGKLEMIIDGGRTGVGLESTVLDLTEEVPTILRPGGITHEDLVKVLGKVEIDKSITNFNEKIIPKSPGQKYKHYAPNSEMIIFEGEMENVISNIKKICEENIALGKKVGIMCTDETENNYNKGLVYSMGSRKNGETIAHNLFYILRDMDKENVDIILAESTSFSEIGLAIMNRMIKAAAGKIVNV